jgi:hypothetical protein
VSVEDRRAYRPLGLVLPHWGHSAAKALVARLGFVGVLLAPMLVQAVELLQQSLMYFVVAVPVRYVPRDFGLAVDLPIAGLVPTPGASPPGASAGPY